MTFAIQLLALPVAILQDEFLARYHLRKTLPELHFVSFSTSWHINSSFSRADLVLFLQHDQDEFLNDWAPMKKAQTLVADAGTRACVAIYKAFCGCSW
mmetsp:Transcript_62791/g.104512  ORF Transcript_62791/g.104512 Transcript_62791/m.104512 type:complete len:98 (-) Transcript_62791:149-442(-)